MNTLFDTPLARLFMSKLDGLVLRLIDIMRLLPIRFRRILHHFRRLFVDAWSDPVRLLSFSYLLTWLIELCFYLIDLVGLGEIYETLAEIVKFNTRPLTADEKRAVREIFGDTINIKRIRIDEHAFMGPRRHRFAYVSFYTVNSWGTLAEEVFMHELVHIWQYQRLGSVYIPRALQAQFSQEGYDYGGLPNLVLAIRSGRGLEHFNLEQQGDIMADYRRILLGQQPRWSLTSEEDLWVFEHLLQDLKSKRRAA